MNFHCFNAHNGDVPFSIDSSSSSSMTNVPNEFYHDFHHNHHFYDYNASHVLFSSYPPSTFAGAGSLINQSYVDAARGFEPNRAYYPNMISSSPSAAATTMSNSPMMIYEPEPAPRVAFGFMPDAELSGGGTGRVNKKANVVKGQWTAEEDRLLVGLVDKYGMRRWSQIAEMLDGRIGKQCRERWHNHLRPNIKKDSWTEEEDMILIQAHSETGNKWSEIAKRLPGRTENSIKNHWNATKRRQFSGRGRRSSKSSKYPPTLLQNYIKSLTTNKEETSSNAAAAAAADGAGNLKLKNIDAAYSSTTTGGEVAATVPEEVFDVVHLFEQLGCGGPPAVSQDQGDRWAEMEMECCWAGAEAEAVPALVTPAMSCENSKKEMDLMEMMSQNDSVIQNLSLN